MSNIMDSIPPSKVKVISGRKKSSIIKKNGKREHLNADGESLTCFYYIIILITTGNHVVSDSDQNVVRDLTLFYSHYYDYIYDYDYISNLFTYFTFF